MKGHTNQLGADLDRWRRTHGYSLKEAGKQFGVSGPGFHYWITGTCEPTRHLDKIADTLAIEEWEAYRRLRIPPEEQLASAAGDIPGWLSSLTTNPDSRLSRLLPFPAPVFSRPLPVATV